MADISGFTPLTGALAMQQIMACFATVTTPAGTEVALSIKISVTAGPPAPSLT